MYSRPYGERGAEWSLNAEGTVVSGAGDDPVPLPSGVRVLLGEAPGGALPGNSAVWLSA